MVTRIGGPNMFPDDDPDAWANAVIETCEPYIEGLPEHLRIDAASAVYVESRASAHKNIPWTVLFDDEDSQVMSDRLLSTALTPTGRTPSHNPEILDTVRTISQRLRAGGIELGAATTQAAGVLVQFAAGKPETSFNLYSDDAREMPMKYSWNYMLEKQCGSVGCRAVLEANPRLEIIVRRTEELTRRYYDDADLSYQSPPDSISGLIHGFLPIDDRYPLYIEAAHRMRALPYPPTK